MIAKMTQYTDEERRQITMFRDIESDELHFSGEAVYRQQLSQGVFQMPFAFEIPAENIEEAYGNWDESIKPGIAKVEAQMREQAGPRVQRAPGGLLDSEGGLIRPQATQRGGNGDRQR